MQEVVSHLTIPDHLEPRVTWLVSAGDSELGMRADSIPDWHYHVDLNVSVELSLEHAAVTESLGWGEGGQLGVALTVSSDAPELIAPPPVPVLSDHARVSVQVPGSLLAGNLVLTVSLVVMEEPREAGPLAPRRPALWVFRKSRTIALEGNAARLPLLPTSFADQGIEGAPFSLWWVRIIDRQLDRPVSDCIWVWVNSDSEIIKSLLDEQKDKSDLIWWRMMQLDFARQLLLEAMNNGDLVEAEGYSPNSFGETLIGLVRTLGLSLTDARQVYSSDPGRLEAQLQATILGAVASKRVGSDD